jgi:PAS domain S-box-containing protein
MKSHENETLRGSEERYRFLFESSPAAVCSIDASGVIQEFNSCAAELWGRAPALGDTEELFCGSDKMFRPDGSFMPHDQCPMAQVVAGVVSEVNNGEVIIQRPDGSRITVIVNIRALTGPGGEIVGAINCFYDITERFQMEQLLQQQANKLTDMNCRLTDMNRHKDEFLAMLGHELRNPLAPIVTSVKVLDKLARESPEQKKVIAIIERQLTQLTRLVDDLTDAARIGRGIVELQLGDVALGDIVERAADSVRPLVDERSQELSVVLPAEPVWLRADAARLEQIIVNLLANAAKYTDRSGRISMSIEQQPDECTLRVRDTGIGISPDLLPHIFELFTQGAPTAERSKGGLGIGLALVHRLVELHHGRVEAHSVLGQGSEFVVTLPTALPRPSRRSRASAEMNGAAVLHLT